MSTVKTAISLDEPLFRKVQACARDLKIPRSRLFSLALEEFLERRANRRLLRRLEEVYSRPFAREDTRLLQVSLGLAAKRLKDDRW